MLVLCSKIYILSKIIQKFIAVLNLRIVKCFKKKQILELWV